MADSDNNSRNPLIIPAKPAPNRPAFSCLECGSTSLSAWMTNGMVIRQCQKCGYRFYGGIGQVPQDPRVPVPPEDPRSVPTTTFARDKSGQVQEVTVRKPDPTPQFRKGLPVPPGEDQ